MAETPVVVERTPEEQEAHDERIRSWAETPGVRLDDLPASYRDEVAAKRAELEDADIPSAPDPDFVDRLARDPEVVPTTLEDDLRAAVEARRDELAEEEAAKTDDPGHLELIKAELDAELQAGDEDDAQAPTLEPGDRIDPADGRLERATEAVEDVRDRLAKRLATYHAGERALAELDRADQRRAALRALPLANTKDARLALAEAITTDLETTLAAVRAELEA